MDLDYAAMKRRFQERLGQVSAAPAQLYPLTEAFSPSLAQHHSLQQRD